MRTERHSSTLLDKWNQLVEKQGYTLATQAELRISGIDHGDMAFWSNFSRKDDTEDFVAMGKCPATSEIDEKWPSHQEIWMGSEWYPSRRDTSWFYLWLMWKWKRSEGPQTNFMIMKLQSPRSRSTKKLERNDWNLSFIHLIHPICSLYVSFLIFHLSIRCGAALYGTIILPPHNHNIPSKFKSLTNIFAHHSWRCISKLICREGRYPWRARDSYQLRKILPPCAILKMPLYYCWEVFNVSFSGRSGRCTRWLDWVLDVRKLLGNIWPLVDVI